MNKEKRKQIELDKKLSRIWQSYKDVKKEKQLELTNRSGGIRFCQMFDTSRKKGDGNIYMVR